MTKYTQNVWQRFVSDDAGNIYVELGGPGAGNLVTTNMIVNIPSNYATLQEAISDLSQYFVKKGVTITLNIEAGHALTTGLLVSNGDYSAFRIVSEDTEVSLDAGFTGTTGISPVHGQDNACIAGVYARMPTLACLIDMNQYDGAGLLVFDGSMCRVEDSCGIKNSDRLGLSVDRGSEIEAGAAIFSGSGKGNNITANSRGNLASADLSGARKVDSSAVAALDVSRGSIVNLMGSSTAVTNLSGSAERGLAARRSIVSANFVDVSGAAADGIRAEQGSTIVCSESDISNVSGVGCHALTGGKIVCGFATITGNTGAAALLADSGSNIDARGADASGASGFGVSCSHGSNVNIRDANCRKGGSDSVDDIRVVSGGIISAFGATGGTSITANTLTSSGIIFQ